MQEKSGYFFCLEDRALLCRQCDVSIHTTSPYVSTHQRFLVTGVRVASQQHSNTTAPNLLSSSTSIASSVELSNKKRRTAGVTTSIHTGEHMVGLRPDWPLDEILTNAEYNSGYSFSELGSSRISSQWFLLLLCFLVFSFSQEGK